MDEPAKQPEDTEPPLDDYGIDHDRILEICEKMVGKLHQKYVIDDEDPISPEEYLHIMRSLREVWGLTQSILDLDDVIRSALEAIIETSGNTQNGDDEDIANDDDEEDYEE